MYMVKETENSVNYFREDYFSPHSGYVIEGRRMTYITAVTYLITHCDMLCNEAHGYLMHLQICSAMQMGVC